MTQEQEAWAVAVELHKLGVRPVLQGDWLVFEKPLPPIDLLMRVQALPANLVDSMILRTTKDD